MGLCVVFSFICALPIRASLLSTSPSTHFQPVTSNLSPPICHLQPPCPLSLPQSSFFVALILYKKFLVLQSRFYYYLAFHKYGCLPPPSLPQKDPIFGIDLILQFFRTTREHRRMQFNQANHARYGNISQSCPFGSRVVSTTAVYNIQAVFAPTWIRSASCHLPTWTSKFCNDSRFLCAKVGCMSSRLRF